MYSSLIIYGVGLSFLFLNYLFLILLFTVFVPMMIVRAGAEEQELEKLGLPGYKDYKEHTQFLIPIFNAPISYFLRISGILFFVLVLIDNRVALDEAVFLSICYLAMSFVVDNPKVSLSGSTGV